MRFGKGMSGRYVWVIVSMMALLCGSCSPKLLPGFRKLAVREQQRITEETRQAIIKSQSLRELDYLYRHEVVTPENFRLVRMSRDFKGETFLVYGYKSDQSWKDVKGYYRKYLAKAGWQLSGEQDVTWGDDFIRFQKQSYQVIVYKASIGSDENYTLIYKRI